MSARVFNPVIVSELKHVRTPGANDRKANFTNNNFASLSPIRRDLFGPVDHEECKMVLERELDRQHNVMMERWEFDFINEVPRPGKGRYIWEATLEKINIRPVKRDYIETASDITHLYHIPLDEVPEKDVKKSMVHLNKKQAKITGNETPLKFIICKFHYELTSIKTKVEMTCF